MTKYKLTSCTPLDGQLGPGFQLPIFTNIDRQGFFIQICSEHKDRVDGFDPIEEPSEFMVELENGVTVNVGDEPIFVFSQQDGSVSWGTKSELIPALKSINLSNAHALQIAELVGGKLEKMRVRESIIEACDGSKFATQALLASVFAQATWDNLKSVTVSDSAFVKMLPYRREVLLNCSLKIEEIVPDDVWVNISPFVSIDRVQLRERLLSEIPETYYKNKEKNVIYTNNEYESRYKGLINSVSYIKRQEERSAFLLQKLIEDPDAARHLVYNYRDRAQLAQGVWKDVKESIENLSTKSHREKFVASMVQRMFSKSYPFTRGETLYFLAKRLGKYPLIARAILRKMETSHAFNVSQWRAHIMQYLELPNESQ